MTNRKKKAVPSTGSESEVNDSDVFSDLSEEQGLIYRALEMKFGSIFEKFEDTLNAKDKKIDELNDELLILRKRISLLEDRIDDNEAYERRDTVVVSGDEVPVATDSEDSARIVAKLIKDKINLNINLSDISVAHRMGNKPLSQAPDKRKIIIKLCRRETKQELLKACRTVKPRNLFISESLTRVRGTALFGLRQAKKKYPDVIAGCGSYDVKVYAWVKPPNVNAPNARNTKISVNSKEKFRDLCIGTIKCNPDDLVSSWPSY